MGQADSGASLSEESRSGSQQIFDAHPIGTLPSPEYPASALKARLGEVVIPMRIVVGREGRVISVERKTGVFAFSIPHSEEFVAKIRLCVAKWRFSPARIITAELDSKGDARTVNEQLIDMSFDVDFVFAESWKREVKVNLNR